MQGDKPTSLRAKTKLKGLQNLGVHKNSRGALKLPLHVFIGSKSKKGNTLS